jgi:hypothetical protein
VSTKLRRFTEVAAESSPSLEELLLSMAAEFRPVDGAHTNRTLTRLGTALATTDRLAALGDILGVLMGFRPTRRPGPDALLLDSALRAKAAEPAMLASIYAIAASRAGIPLTVASTGDRWLVAHEHHVLDPVQTGALLTSEEIPEHLHPRIPHEIAHALLTQLTEAYAVQGDLRRATRAAELRLELPRPRISARPTSPSAAGTGQA